MITRKPFCPLLFSLLLLTTTASAQTCVTPPSGIIAWWTLDETTGNIAHDSIGTESAAYFGSPFQTPGLVAGALKFNGSTDYLGAPQNPEWDFGTNDFTIELWANFAVVPGGSIGEPAAIFIGDDEGPENRNKWFFATGGGNLYFHINSPTLGPQFFPLTPFAPAVNTWYHLAVTRSGSLYSVYIDGKLAASAVNTNGVSSPAAALTIGEAENIGFMNGLLDEVTVYDRSLTDAEVASIWSVNKAGKCKASTGQTLQIQSISPPAGGNAGQTTVSITGTGFQPGATVNLVSGSQTLVLGSNTGITVDGKLQSTFDLTTVTAQNSLQVEVDNPDGTSATSAFQVVDGGAPQLELELVGPATARVGRLAEFAVIVRNVGLIDAPSASVSVTSTFPHVGAVPLTPIPAIPVIIPPNVPQPPDQVVLSSDPNTLIIFGLPAGQAIPAYFSLQTPSDSCDETVGSGGTTQPDPNDPCRPEEMAVNMLTDALNDKNNQLSDAYTAYNALDCGKPSMKQIFKNECQALTDQIWELINEISNLKKRLKTAQDELDACRKKHPGSGSAASLAAGVVVSASQQVCPITSWDPNAKVGPVGVGPSGFVSGQLVPYTVFFENLAAATAPAQQISIVDPLDLAVNPNAVSLDSLSMSGTVIDLGGGLHVSRTVDLRPATNALMKIQGDVDTLKRQINWALTALDPTTLQLPSDPQVGILPPNKVPPQGEGNVTFTVSAQQGTTRTSIHNQATVVFDTNPPISTATWVNALDNTPPVSHVLALPAVEATSSFTVSWSGTDIGSGVKSFTVFVSDNGGPFSAWQINNTGTSATYIGQNGHTYGFYSIATDNVGNIEGMKQSPEASITIVPPIATTAIVSSSANPGDLNSTITFTATVTPATNAGNLTGTVAFNDASTFLGTASLNSAGQALFSTNSLSAGTHSITAIYSGNLEYVGSQSAALNETINAPGYSITLSPYTVSVARRRPAQTSVVVTPVGGFNSTVTISCSGLPAYTTCSLSPTTLTPDGTNSVMSSTLTISTNVRPTSAIASGKTSEPHRLRGRGVSVLAVVFMPLLLFLPLNFNFTFERWRRVINILIAAIVLTAATAVVGGCGADHTTPKGTTLVTITANGGGSSHSANLTLIVQ
jgi:hypothetical protein